MIKVCAGADSVGTVKKCAGQKILTTVIKVPSMYELVFIFLVTTKAGLPGFHMERMGQFRTQEDCEKTRTTLVEYTDRLVKENRMFPGVFECRKSQQ